MKLWCFTDKGDLLGIAHRQSGGAPHRVRPHITKPYRCVGPVFPPKGIYHFKALDWRWSFCLRGCPEVVRVTGRTRTRTAARGVQSGDLQLRGHRGYLRPVPLVRSP